MLVVFRSSATESITMFKDHAVELLRMMGATGHIPGAFNADDVPAALARLESAVEQLKMVKHADTPVRPADNEDWASDEDKELEKRQPIAITTRAVPLLSILKRAAAAKAEISWEKA